MATVKFNDTNEFIEELNRDAASVERGIVRLTCRFSRNEMFTALAIVASAFVAGHVVTLEVRCGNYLSHDGPDGREIRAKADAEREKLAKALTELDFSIRAGSFVA